MWLNLYYITLSVHIWASQIDFQLQWRLFNNEDSNSHNPTLLHHVIEQRHSFHCFDWEKLHHKSFALRLCSILTLQLSNINPWKHVAFSALSWKGHYDIMIIFPSVLPCHLDAMKQRTVADNDEIIHSQEWGSRTHPGGLKYSSQAAE